MTRHEVVLALLTAGLLLATSSAQAGGGIEINHVGAEAGSVTAGDDPGYPVTITTPGSYVLTGTLVVPGGAHGIDVTVAPGDGPVSIDLGGHVIEGPGSCTDTGSSISCTGHSSFRSGIRGINRPGITVTNGNITGFWNAIEIGDACRIEGVRARESAREAFLLGSRCLVSHVAVWLNGRDGILAGEATLVVDSTAGRNSNDGIMLGATSVVREVAARDNGQRGVSVGVGSVVADSSVSANGNVGIVGADSLLDGNAARSNLIGLSLNPGSLYTNQSINEGDASAVSPVIGGFDADPNVCDGGSCP